MPKTKAKFIIIFLILILIFNIFIACSKGDGAEIATEKGEVTKTDVSCDECRRLDFGKDWKFILLKLIAETILSHHKWYDGSGYPRGG